MLAHRATGIHINIIPESSAFYTLHLALPNKSAELQKEWW